MSARLPILQQLLQCRRQRLSRFPATSTSSAAVRYRTPWKLPPIQLPSGRPTLPGKNRRQRAQAWLGAAPAHGYLGALTLPAGGPRPTPCTATPQLCLPQTTYKQAPALRVLRGSRACHVPPTHLYSGRCPVLFTAALAVTQPLWPAGGKLCICVASGLASRARARYGRSVGFIERSRALAAAPVAMKSCTSVSHGFDTLALAFGFWLWNAGRTRQQPRLIVRAGMVVIDKTQI